MTDLTPMQAADARALLPERSDYAHKGAFGAVLIIAGGRTYPGAPLLAARAAAKSGAGIVHLAAPIGIRDACAGAVPEAIIHPLDETADGWIAANAASQIGAVLEEADATLVGPGLGRAPDTIAFVSDLLTKFNPNKAVILDADALFALTEIAAWQTKTQAAIVITPHPKELARLIEFEIAPDRAARRQVATRAASKFGGVVVLKGAETVIAAPDGALWLSPWANSGMSKGGVGDALGGLMSGLAAQMPREPTKFAPLAVYLHGLAAGLATNEMGAEATTPSEIIDRIGSAFLALKTA